MLAASLFADTGPALGRRKAAVAAPSLLAGIGVADAQTTTGRIAGYRHQGMFVFKGVPYAIAPRMGLPVSHPSWGGVRSSKQYGAVCPQQPRNTWIFDDVAWMYDWNDGHANEDCLNLNVWTPALADGRKRPVMVWLHGGGFEAGSSHELKAYDGESLSRRGDVVVISPNHRVGVLGFLAVSGTIAGEAIDGANLGMLDLVAALHWARDNAAAFGGDPNNVTLFGQSGGGGKINALMAMPAAQGLFHRAISQSAAFPSYRHMATPDVSAKLAKVVLDTLGIAATDLTKLRAVPLDQFMQAGSAAQKAFRVPWKPDVIDASLTWGPTVDGKVLPEAPFAAAAPAISRDIPLLLGTVQNEFSPALYDPALLQLTEAGLQQRVAALHGPRADQVLAAFRAAHPQATPVELISLISSSVFRQNVLEQATMKAAQGGAPAWCTCLTGKRHCSTDGLVRSTVRICRSCSTTPTGLRR